MALYRQNQDLASGSTTPSFETANPELFWVFASVEVLYSSLIYWLFNMYNIKQYVFMYATLLSSMVTGASIMHHILKPDLTLKPDNAAASNGDNMQ